MTPGHAHEDLAKAHALGSALLVCCAIPWGMCFIIYTGDFWCHVRSRSAPQVYMYLSRGTCVRVLR